MYTKGKWEVFTGDHLTYIVSKNTSIAIMCTDNKKSSDACKDNARLIAAAPELLQACEEAVKTLKSYLSTYPISVCSDKLVKAINKAKDGA